MELSFRTKEVVTPTMQARPDDAIEEAFMHKREGNKGPKLKIRKRGKRNQGQAMLLTPIQHAGL